jgi:hypothetical protein
MRNRRKCMLTVNCCQCWGAWSEVLFGQHAVMQISQKLAHNKALLYSVSFLARTSIPRHKLSHNKLELPFQLLLVCFLCADVSIFMASQWHWRTWRLKVKVSVGGLFNTSTAWVYCILTTTSYRIHLQRHHASYRCARPLPAILLADL